MYIFSRDKRTLVIHELLSWLGLVFAFAIFGLLTTSVFHWNIKTTFYSVSIVLFFKFLEALSRSTVDKINIDTAANSLKIELSSWMSGEKSVSFGIKDVKARYSEPTSFQKVIFKPTVLDLQLPGNKRFRLTPRYGMSQNSLRDIFEIFQINGQTI